RAAGDEILAVEIASEQTGRPGPAVRTFGIRRTRSVDAVERRERHLDVFTEDGRVPLEVEVVDLLVRPRNQIRQTSAARTGAIRSVRQARRDIEDAHLAGVHPFGILDRARSDANVPAGAGAGRTARTWRQTIWRLIDRRYDLLKHRTALEREIDAVLAQPLIRIDPVGPFFATASVDTHHRARLDREHGLLRRREVSE